MDEKHTNVTTDQHEAAPANVPAAVASEQGRDGRPGVGLTYQKEILPFLVEHLEMLDYLEIMPDYAWTDRGAGASPRYVEDAESLRFFRELRRRVPIVAHGTSLSIASAHRFRREHVDQISRWDGMLDFSWHSDHLSFKMVTGSSGEYLGGVHFPAMLDRALVDLLVERVQQVRSKIPKPFLLENSVSYIRYTGEDFDEPAFFNELCARSGCDILLDLHNVYTNWRNKVCDMDAYFASLDLSRVVEIHLAGGFTHGGFYLDVHSGPVPDELWATAAAVARSCPNSRGITFELQGFWYRRMGPEAMEETLARTRELARAARS